MQSVELWIRSRVFDRQTRNHGMRLSEELRIDHTTGLRHQRQDLRQCLRDEEGGLLREGQHHGAIHRSLW